MTERHIIDWPEGYHETLVDIGSIVAGGLVSLGLDAPQVQAGAFAITEAIRRECGGTYLPRGKSLELSQREEQIWQKFDGTNYTMLAKTYGLCEVQIRNIVRRARDRLRKREQRTLFDEA